MKRPGWAVLGALLFGGGLYVFTAGFLSVRKELKDVSTFTDTFSSSSTHDEHSSPRSQNSRGYAPSYDKAVLLVIDALREDFYFNSSSHNQHPAANDLPLLRSLVQAAGPAALASRFVADSPTITISRLKAWLTGCLPTFLDVGQSFSAITLGEDNLLEQLSTQGKRTVFMGDDTWLQLAPAGVFAAAHPYPSFNVLDLHTVDDGVWQNLQAYLSEPDTWDVLVAHYLGVDHAGHAHGVGSQAMATKLAQMDAQAAQVAEQLLREAGPGGPHERTLLLVLSDHGQTLGGDHGGGSPAETDTLLLAFNMHRWWQHAHHNGSKSTSLGPVHADANTGSGSAISAAQVEGTVTSGGDARAVEYPLIITIPQLDFTATFASLMGIPVPYSNLGSINAFLWQVLFNGPGGPAAGHDQQQAAGDAGQAQAAAETSGAAAVATQHGQDQQQEEEVLCQSCHAVAAELQQPLRLMSDQQRLAYAHALMMTCTQVHRYLKHYSKAASLPADQLHKSQQLFSQAYALYDSTIQTAAGDIKPADVQCAVCACHAFLVTAAALGRSQFSGCNVPRMVAGCGLMIVAVMALVKALAHRLTALGLVASYSTAEVSADPSSLVPPHPASSTAVQVLSDPVVLLPLCITLFHSFSLFGLDWMMSEGSVQCHAAAAAIASLGGVVAWRAVKTSRSAAAAERHQNEGTAASSRSSGWPIALKQLRWSLLGVVCVDFMAAWGLMDRSSSDPHDKAAQSTTLEDLLGAGGSAAPDALTNTVLLHQAYGTVLPLLVLPWITWAVYSRLCRLLSRLKAGSQAQSNNSVQQQLSGEQQTGRSLVHTIMLCLACVQYGCGALWWMLQLLGPSYHAATIQQAWNWAASQLYQHAAGESQLSWPLVQGPVAWLGITSAAAAAPFIAIIRSSAAASNTQSAQCKRNWQRFAALAVVGLALLAAGMSKKSGNDYGSGSRNKWVSALLELPLRLLLPRVVYLGAGIGLRVIVMQSIARPLVQRLRKRKPDPVVPAGTASNSKGHHEKEWGMGCFWLAAVLWAPVTLLLGLRGPWVMLLLAVAAAACCCLAYTAAFYAAKRSIRRNGTRESDTRSSMQTETAAAGSAQQQGLAARSRVSIVQAAQVHAAPAAVAAAVLMSTLSSAAFFASGHFCEFTGLQYASPFIGFDEMQRWISPLLMSLNTFGAMLVVALASGLLPLVVLSAAVQGRSSVKCGECLQAHPVTEQVTPSEEDTASQQAVQPCLKHLAVIVLLTSLTTRCITSCVVSLVGTVLHNHILVWAIIAPRFVFELCFMLVTVVGLALTACLQ